MFHWWEILTRPSQQVCGGEEGMTHKTCPDNKYPLREKIIKKVSEQPEPANETEKDGGKTTHHIPNNQSIKLKLQAPRATKHQCL